MTEADVDQLMRVMDSNRNGYIDYTEFIAGCLQSYNYLKENHLKTAFSYYDKDSNGTISLDELKQCLQSEELTLPDSVIEKLMTEVDQNKDGCVSQAQMAPIGIGCYIILIPNSAIYLMRDTQYINLSIWLTLIYIYITIYSIMVRRLYTPAFA